MSKLADKLQEIRKAYEVDLRSLQDIADEHGVAAGTVRALLAKHGVTFRPRGRKRAAAKTVNTTPQFTAPVSEEVVKEAF